MSYPLAAETTAMDTGKSIIRISVGAPPPMTLAAPPTPESTHRRHGRLRRMLPLLVTLGCLLVVVVVFILSRGARDQADAFLLRFRTGNRQTVAIIDVPLPRVPGVSDAALEDLIDVELPQSTSARFAGEAQERVDFNVRSLERGHTAKVDVYVQQEATLRFNRAALERSLGPLAVGFGLQLPRELDTPVQASLTAVRQVWTDPTGDITLWIMRTPRFRTNEGLTWDELRDRLLQVASIAAPERALQLRQVENWDNTIVVPIPPNATTRRVRADSTDNVLVVERPGRTTLVWQRFGVLHILDASMPAAAVIRMANTID